MQPDAPATAERFLTTLTSPREEDVRQPPLSIQAAPSPSRYLRETRTRAAWSRKIAGWMLLSTLLIWGSAILIWGFLWATPKNTPISFDGEPTLREATQAWARSVDTPNYDQLCLCLHATLPALYDFTPDGAPMRAIVKGAMAPQLIAGAEAAFRRDRTIITQKGVRQVFHLRLPNAADIQFDADSRRVSVMVQGEFELTFMKDPKAKAITLPFAGRVVLSRNVPSSVNPFHFYIEDIVQSATKR